MSSTSLAIKNKEALTIANLFLVGKTEEDISNELNISIDEVKYVLASDEVQKYLTNSSQNTELQLHLKRIKKANDLVDKLLEKVDDMINDDKFPMYMRKDSHVSIIKDVLLQRLPNTISKTVGLAIQMNFGKQNSIVEQDTSSLDHILKRLEPWQVILFWQAVDMIGELFTLGKVNEINKLMDVLSNLTNDVIIESP
jgi:hypothetical protein